MNLNKLNSWRLTPTQLILLSGVLLTLLYNYPFLNAVYTAVQPATADQWFFLLSVPLLLIALLLFVLCMTGAFLFPRIVLSVHVVLSALVFYGTVAYGVVLDKSMIQNIMETDTGEALSYLNFQLIAFFISGVAMPVLFIWKLHSRVALRLRLWGMLKVMAVSLVVITAIAGLMYKDYASVGRNHRSLSKYVTPLALYDSTYKYVRDKYFYPPLPFRVLDNAPTLLPQHAGQAQTLVLVVGETARADKFSLNGYARNTNPALSELNVVSFTQATSCGTATAVSVPCMFSRMNRQDYDRRIAESQDNVLDIIQRAGVEVLWIDNNSTCKGVCVRVPNIEHDPSRDATLCDGDYCYDDILLLQLKEALRAPTKAAKRFIILHTIGSHGPTYYRRYPEPYRQFTPDCPRSDIQNCDNQELANTYDNTILYTDHILAEVIKEIQALPNAEMLYLSDHGESLGEKGIYLHGFPYHLAPDEQKHIPMVFWSAEMEQRPDYATCVKSLENTPVSQDNLYDILLGLTNVQSKTYRPDVDIFNACR